MIALRLSTTVHPSSCRWHAYGAVHAKRDGQYSTVQYHAKRDGQYHDTGMAVEEGMPSAGARMPHGGRAIGAHACMAPSMTQRSS